MAIQRPADARPVAAHAFRGFNGLIGHEVVAWRPGFVGAWRPSSSQSTFAAETEIYDHKGDLLATGAGTFRYLKGERSDGTLTFLDQKAAD